jgi:hypothetical protein
MMFSEGRQLLLGALLFLLGLDLKRFEIGLAQRLAVDRGEGVIAEDSSDLHFF